jgi:SET domain-containing protein
MTVTRTRNWELRASRVHGRGVFAARDLKKGTRIIEYVGRRLSHEAADRLGLQREARAKRSGRAMTYLFELNSRWCLDGLIPGNPARFINHSCSPNCEAVISSHHRIWVLALRAIRAGEELTYDYGFDLENYEDHPCRCGSDPCVGYIVARRHWGPLLRILGEKKPRVAARSQR